MGSQDWREKGCCSVNFLKYVLFIFNFLFFLAGIAVFSIGIWTVVAKHSYISLLATSTYAATAYILIAAGLLVIIVTIIGCVGVIQEDKCYLLIYTFLLLIIFLLEAIAGVLAYVYEKQVHQELSTSLNKTFLENYDIDSDITIAIDDMQRQFKCCGPEYFNDWENSNWFRKHKSGNLVPESCCKSEMKNCGYDKHPNNIYYTGCIHQFENVLKDHLVILGAVGLGLCIIQIFGMIFACCLYIRLKDYKLIAY